MKKVIMMTLLLGFFAQVANAGPSPRGAAGAVATGAKSHLPGQGDDTTATATAPVPATATA